MRPALAIRLAAPLIAVALAACSPSGGPDSGTEGTAIQSDPYMRLPGIVPTGTVIDFASLLYNSDDTPFRVLSIRLISPTGPGIGQVKIRALAPSRYQGGTFAYFQGNLARCPRHFGYRVKPVTDIVEPKHGVSDWRPLFSIVFTKPGRYHLFLEKVDYVEGGQRYWNYVRADISVRAVPPKTDPHLIQPAC